MAEKKLDGMTDFDVLNKLDRSYKDDKPHITGFNSVSILERPIVSEVKVNSSYTDNNSELDQIINSTLFKSYGIRS